MADEVGSHESADNGLYIERRCQYNNLYKKIYQKCNCISKYVDDIHEFFPAVENYRQVSVIEFEYLHSM